MSHTFLWAIVRQSCFNQLKFLSLATLLDSWSNFRIIIQVCTQKNCLITHGKSAVPGVFHRSAWSECSLLMYIAWQFEEGFFGVLRDSFFFCWVFIYLHDLTWHRLP